MVKPDMSAPGTIEAAVPGTGNGMNTESGTSFACPLTAGVAALLLSKNHTLGPLDVKALLIETAEINVFENSLTEPGTLAPLSRVGGPRHSGEHGGLGFERAAGSKHFLQDLPAQREPKFQEETDRQKLQQYQPHI